MPRISVVIATYKRPEKLLRAVRTALAQTVTDLEVIVAVESNDPESVDALKAIADPRVIHVVNPAAKDGPGPARDLGARSATGDYIAFLDDDDEWVPYKLERQLAVAGPDIIVTALSRVVTDEGDFIRPGRPYDGAKPIDEWLFDRHSWLRGGDSMLQTSSLLIPAPLMRTLGFGNARHEEWELVIRAVKQHGYRLVTVHEPLVIYYAGGLYPWRPSLGWVEGMRDVMTPRALAAFCLSNATQGLVGPERNLAFRTFFRTAFRIGKPTAKQLFAFAMIWGVSHSLRWRLRAMLGQGAAKPGT
ncbi:MAG: glycosyltransferase family 2 protein [Sphingobium sp.]